MACLLLDCPVLCYLPDISAIICHMIGSMSVPTFPPPLWEGKLRVTDVSMVVPVDNHFEGLVTSLGVICAEMPSSCLDVI